jgi:hypothetical protein
MCIVSHCRQRVFLLCVGWWCCCACVLCHIVDSDSESMRNSTERGGNTAAHSSIDAHLKNLRLAYNPSESHSRLKAILQHIKAMTNA